MQERALVRDLDPVRAVVLLARREAEQGLRAMSETAVAQRATFCTTSFSSWLRNVSDRAAIVANAHEVVVLQAELTAQCESGRSDLSAKRTGSRMR